MTRLLLAALLTLLAAPSVQASGTHADPFAPPRYFVHQFDTLLAGERVFDNYSCVVGTPEPGPEVVYRLDLPWAADLDVHILGDDGTIDNDVHILSDLAVSGGTATGCLARGHRFALAMDVPAGEVFVVVDVWDDEVHAGPYTLIVDARPIDSLMPHAVADGVVWERGVLQRFGDRLAINLLRVDPSTVTVDVASGGCSTVQNRAEPMGAIAAVNAGFFSAGCADVGLLVDGGVELNAAAGDRAGLVVRSDAVTIEGVPAGTYPAPAADEAVSGRGELGPGSPMALASEGASASFIDTHHPRTVVALAADGSLMLLTIDGRTPVSGGIALTDLATLLEELGAVHAINLDGGGSSTMWIRAHPSSLPVSYPSDNLESDHLGARAVGSMVAVGDATLNHPPFFVTLPGTGALADAETFLYLPRANDPDGDVVTLSLVSGPVGASLLAGELSFTPTFRQGGVHQITLEASDPSSAWAEQILWVTVVVRDADADGLPDAWEELFGLDTGVDDAGADPDGDGATNAQEYAADTDPMTAPPLPDAWVPGDGGPSGAGDAVAGASDARIYQGETPGGVSGTGDHQRGDDDFSLPPGGCSCAGRGNGSPPAIAALLVLGLVTRRRRGGRI